MEVGALKTFNTSELVQAYHGKEVRFLTGTLLTTIHYEVVAASNRALNVWRYMKQCGKCKSVLDAEMFNKSSASKDGLFWICKKCKKEYSAGYYKKNRANMIQNAKDWAEKNKERRSELNAKWRANNPEKHLDSFRNWREKNKELHVKKVVDWQKLNPEKVKLSHDKWAKNNRHVFRMVAAERRAICKSATPKWANKFFMKEIYHLARLRSEATGFMWHVDHVIPLKGKNVCGLHVETNMQVIPWIENIRKSNKF
jgi:hypothetical protein